MIRAALVLAAAIVALLLGYVLLGSPNVVFRSSDGKWADSEVQFKGRNFETIVWNFEGYKLKCAAADAVLFRATPQNWFNVFAWRSYFTDAKWKVPYSNAHSEIGSYYPSADTAGCYNRNWSPEIMKAADDNAAHYLSRLR